MNRVMFILLLLAVLGGVLHYKKQAAIAPDVPLARNAQGQVIVEMYATSWCGYCKAMREHFAASGIRYTEYDIEQDTAAARRHADLGGQGVPVTHIGKRIVIHGFAPEQVTAALAQ